jgi:hypothetical protein
MVRAQSTARWQREQSPIQFSPDFPVLLLIFALILAAPVDLYLAYRVFTSDARFASLVALLIIGAMIGLVILAVSQLGQGIVGSFESDATDQEIHNEVVRLFAPAGWTLNGSTATEIWYSHEYGPRLGIAALLLLFGVFPAIVYVIVARNEQVAHISWRTGAGGLKWIDVGVTPKNPNGRAIVKWLHRRLGA